jgi:hypothetical protein
MSLITPHAERRLEAPLRTLALSGENWRGLSHRKIAENYARHRAEMNEALKRVEVESERFSSRQRRRATTASDQGWFKGILQRLGVADPKEVTFP